LTLDEPPSILLAGLFANINSFYVFSFAAIAVLLFLSAIISASEVAFFSLKANDLDRCRESEDVSEKNIVVLLNKPRLLLATILIMNNFVNVGVVTISTFLMWEMTGTRKPEETIVGLVTFGATFAITFFGEIVPKVYATRHNWTFSKRMSAIWLFLEKVWYPISWLLLTMSQIIERRIEKKGYSSTVEELNQALELTTHNSETTEEEKDILKGIVNFGTLTVKRIMKSRLDISAIDADINFHELMLHINKWGFSRIPVYKGSIDKVEGILYTKDLLPHLNEESEFKWQKLLRPGFFVPETKRLDSLLKDFQTKRVHMAIVVDEYGGTAGLVTLEDLIEEIIGEINDEFDEVTVGFQKVDDHNFIFEAKISIHDLCKALDVDVTSFDDVKGENESLAGLVLELHGSMPKQGEQVIFEPFIFTVISADLKKINKVKVTLQQAAA
ncbi:MAG: gliding motility-associated protein GldE, partial [Flammeovirgaceae bacterium]